MVNSNFQALQRKGERKKNIHWKDGRNLWKKRKTRETKKRKFKEKLLPVRAADRIVQSYGVGFCQKNAKTKRYEEEVPGTFRRQEAGNELEVTKKIRTG